MNDFAFPTNRLLLAGLLLGTGLAARAQTITLNGSAAAATAAQVGGGGLQYACTAYSPASPLSNPQELIFAPGTLNERVESWALLGDGTALTGFSGAAFKFSPTGFGKARVTVSYSYDTKAVATVYCPDGKTPALCGGQPFTTPIRAYATLTYDFYKGFTQAQANYSIKGPTCVPVDNPSLVYSVDAPVISTQSQVQAGLGTDTYEWSVSYPSAPTVQLGVATADGSSYIIPGSSLRTGTFTVKVKVGKCNVYSAPISVAVAPDLNSPSASPLVNFPSCLPVGTTGNVAFGLKTVAGVNYTISSTNSAIAVMQPSFVGTGSITPTTVTLSGFTATNSTIITIAAVSTGSTCFGRQTTVQAINRQLVSTQNFITPACVPPSTPNVVLTLTNAPSGVTWGLPSGWTFVSQTVDQVTVNTGAAGGNVTAVAGGCTSGIITQAVKVKGQITGCTFPVTPSAGACGSYVSTITGPCATPGDPNNAGNKFVEWKLEELVAGTWTQRALNTPTGNLVFSNSTIFGYGTSIPSPNARVTVRVTNDNNCLDYPYVYTGFYTKCGPRPAAGPGNGGSSSAPATEQVQVYPNPVGSQLSINLEADLSAGPAALTLLDALGRTVQTMTTDKPRAALDVRQVPTGFYTLRVALPTGKVLTQPVQVQH